MARFLKDRRRLPITRVEDRRYCSEDDATRLGPGSLELQKPFQRTVSTVRMGNVHPDGSRRKTLLGTACRRGYRSLLQLDTSMDIPFSKKKPNAKYTEKQSRPVLLPDDAAHALRTVLSAPALRENSHKGNSQGLEEPSYVVAADFIGNGLHDSLSTASGGSALGTDSQRRSAPALRASRSFVNVRSCAARTWERLEQTSRSAPGKRWPRDTERFKTNEIFYGHVIKDDLHKPGPGAYQAISTPLEKSLRDLDEQLGIGTTKQTFVDVNQERTQRRKKTNARPGVEEPVVTHPLAYHGQVEVDDVREAVRRQQETVPFKSQQRRFLSNEAMITDDSRLLYLPTDYRGRSRLDNDPVQTYTDVIRENDIVQKEREKPVHMQIPRHRLSLSGRMGRLKPTSTFMNPGRTTLSFQKPKTWNMDDVRVSDKFLHNSTTRNPAVPTCRVSERFLEEKLRKEEAHDLKEARELNKRLRQNASLY